MTKTPLTLLLLGILVPTAVRAGVLVKLDEPEPGEDAIAGFELHRDGQVEVEATVLAVHEHLGALTAAWILDARSREVVWTAVPPKSEGRGRGLHTVTAVLKLPKGAYEVHYAIYSVLEDADDAESWWAKAAQALGRKIFGWDDYEELLDDLGVVVEGSGDKLSRDDMKEIVDRRRHEALASLVAVDDKDSDHTAFLLDRPTELEIYALGELTEDGAYDYGWIVDAGSRKKVWSFTYSSSEPAGGADKNRRVHTALTLPPGRYAAYFVTDGSHSPDAWNTLPPYDPWFWGLTLWVKDPDQRAHVQLTEYRHLPDDKLIVALTRLRDNEHRKQGLTLRKPMDVRIYAVGEVLHDRMVDYGWIVDARTLVPIWTMDYGRTVEAGGASKNRLVDEVVHLEAGSYYVVFVTDGSHSYRDWNDRPPEQPERWGISLFAVDALDRSAVAREVELGDLGVLAEITRVCDAADERRDFSLDRAARVSIYAIGEGADGRMYDYGWITDARTGKRVWTMAFAETRPAGGAAKNRLFQGTVDLAAGSYVLHYRSDDSHSYRGWNSDPPLDPEGWGIRVSSTE